MMELIITACRMSLLHLVLFVLRVVGQTRKRESLPLEIERPIRFGILEGERRKGVASQKLIKLFDSCEGTVDIIQAVQI